MRRIIWFTLLLGAVVCGPVRAAEKSGGLAVSRVMPHGDFEQIAQDGWGVGTIFDYPAIGLLNLTGSATWYRFPGAAANVGATTVWEFSAGPQLDGGKLYLGVELGHYSNVDEWSLVPNAGLRWTVVDLGLRYKATGDARFLAVRAGLFF